MNYVTIEDQSMWLEEAKSWKDLVCPICAAPLVVTYSKGEVYGDFRETLQCPECKNQIRVHKENTVRYTASAEVPQLISRDCVERVTAVINHDMGKYAFSGDQIEVALQRFVYREMAGLIEDVGERFVADILKTGGHGYLGPAEIYRQAEAKFAEGDVNFDAARDAGFARDAKEDED